MNVLTRKTVSTMRLETKYLRLRTPVSLGSRFGDWEVCWLGGWSKHRLHYLVMAVRVASDENDRQKSFTTGWKRRWRQRRSEVITFRVIDAVTREIITDIHYTVDGTQKRGQRTTWQQNANQPMPKLPIT